MLHIYLSQSLTSHQIIYQLKYIILCIISSLNHHAYICCTTTDTTDHGPWFINLRLWLMTHGSCLMFMLQNRHQYKMKRFMLSWLTKYESFKRPLLGLGALREAGYIPYHIKVLTLRSLGVAIQIWQAWFSLNPKMGLDLKNRRGHIDPMIPMIMYLSNLSDLSTL